MMRAADLHARIVGRVPVARQDTQRTGLGADRFEYRDEKSFLGWLYTIAANVLYSHQRRRRVVVTPFDAREELIDQRSQDDARTITDRVALLQAIEQLNRDQQQVLALRFFADMSNSEIAGLLRRTEGAVKAIQHRAIQSLQRLLAREAEESAAYRGQATLFEREVARPLIFDRPSPLESPVGD